jgi:pimeloyl-ACP methyl ester carboxylesterase
LSGLTAPALILRGSLTHPIMASINDGLARRMQDATSEIIDGAGHMVPITHPGPTAQAMTRRFGWSCNGDG